MLVVSDSTPLISLMKTTHLDLLRKLFGCVVIPEAVFKEVTTNKKFSEEAELIKSSDYIKVVSVSDIRQVILIQRITGLDRGESEAVIYADDNHADILLMDEAAGRKVAKDMGITVMGTVGILVSAFRKGFLSKTEVEEALEKIKQAYK